MTERDLILNRARAAELSRDFSLAARLYKTLLKQNPDDNALLVQMGGLYVKSGQNEKALPYFQKIVDKDPGNFDALTSLGGIYRRLKRYDESISVLQKALDTGLDDAQVYYNLGFTYKFMGKDEDAIDCFKTVIEENPNDVLAFNHMGAIYAGRKDYEKAVSAYQRGLKIDPNHPVLHLNLAKTYEALHEYDKAETSYLSALRARPGWQEAIEDFAKLLLRTHQSKKAETLVRQAVRLNNRSAHMHVLLGGCFLAESDYRNALSEYKEALDIEPENAAALSGAASANEKLGMKENSLETMQLLKKLKPDDPGVARQYAHVLLSANRPDAAFSLITGVLDKMPKDLQTLNLLGQYYICREDDRKAEETYSRIESIDPSYADCYRDAAERFAQLGYLKKAEKYIREFLERKPEDPSGLLVLAVLYEAEKMISEALVQYHKVLKYDRYNSIALDAVRRLGDVMNAEAEKQPPVEDVNRDFDDNTPEIPMGIDDRQFEDQKNTTEGKSSGKQDEDFDFDMWNGETTVASAIDEPLDLPEDSEPPEQPEESGNTLDDLVEGDNPIDFSPAPPEQPDPFDSAAAPSDDDTEPEEDLPDMPDESAQDSVSPLPEDEDKENVPEKPEESGSESADKEIPPEALKELKDAQDRVAAETRKATAAADQAVRAAEDAADTARGLKHKADSIAEDVARDAAEKIQNAARDAADTASELARQQAEDMLRRAKSMLDEALNKNKEQEETSETPEPVQEVETPVSVLEPQKVYEYVPPEIPEQEENKDAESENGKQPVMKDTYDTFEETARMLPAIVNMLMNTENADRYPELLELFKKLHTLSEYLPPEKRQQFLSGKDRIQLDYVISKLEGKPGLLATAQALRKAARLDSEHSLETYETIELSGDELVRNVLDLMTDLSSSLEDPTLITALGGIADDVRRRLDTGNGI